MRTKKGKMPKLKYFFYRGDLHKKIYINRSDDIIDAWNYPKGELRQYVYSDVRQNGEQAYTTRQVGELVGRSPKIIKEHIQKGMVRRPQMTYSLDEPANTYAFYWSEKDIMELHDFLRTVHFGRPRLDGRATPLAMPSRAELRAALRQGTVFYIKDGESFVPTWKAESL